MLRLGSLSPEVILSCPDPLQRVVGTIRLQATCLESRTNEVDERISGRYGWPGLMENVARNLNEDRIVPTIGVFERV